MSALRPGITAEVISPILRSILSRFPLDASSLKVSKSSIFSIFLDKPTSVPPPTPEPIMWATVPFLAATKDVPVPMLTTIASSRLVRYNPPRPTQSNSGTICVGSPNMLSPKWDAPTPVAKILVTLCKSFPVSSRNFPTPP